MSTTIAHPRSAGSGLSGKTVAGVLVGALAALAIGYGINVGADSVDGAAPVTDSARAAMQRIQDFEAEQSASSGAGLVILDVDDYAAQEEAELEFLKNWQRNPEPTPILPRTEPNYGNFVE